MATVTEPTPRSTGSVMQGAGWMPANPAPLGLAGLGLTILMWSLVNSSIISPSDTPVVLGMAFAYGGLAQLLAGMWEFRTGNTFGAAAFSSYGGFWISFFFLVTFDAKLLDPAHAGHAIGAYLWVWSLMTFIFLLCSFRSPRLLSSMLLLLTIMFALLAIGSDGNSTSMTHAGGFVGIAAAANALYLVAANIMESVYERPVLPTFPAR